MDVYNLEQLLQEPIINITALDPGYSGHASDVWLVQTAVSEVVVRSSRLRNEPDNDFWWGCHFLFGIDPRQAIYLEENEKLLNGIPDIPAPNIISKARIAGREYVVVEKMKGRALQTFTGQPDLLLHQFGVWLAKVHSNRYPFFGNLAKTKTRKKEHFHLELAEAMERLVSRYYSGSSEITAQLKPILEELSMLPVPKDFCPVLADMDPSQFLADQGRITAIVDTEAYVVAPREFDFVGLEYVLDKQAVQAFVGGYTSVLELSDLSKYRKVYRYFYRLLGVQGSVKLDRWLARPELFSPS